MLSFSVTTDQEEPHVHQETLPTLSVSLVVSISSLVSSGSTPSIAMKTNFFEF